MAFQMKTTEAQTRAPVLGSTFAMWCGQSVLTKSRCNWQRQAELYARVPWFLDFLILWLLPSCCTGPDSSIALTVPSGHLGISETWDIETALWVPAIPAWSLKVSQRHLDPQGHVFSCEHGFGQTAWSIIQDPCMLHGRGEIFCWCSFLRLFDGWCQDLMIFYFFAGALIISWDKARILLQVVYLCELLQVLSLRQGPRVASINAMVGGPWLNLCDFPFFSSWWRTWYNFGF